MSKSFHELASAHGFGNQSELLQKYALPCIGFGLKPKANRDIGSSRIGGGPDLPPSFAWPANKDRPLDFLLQVNLADVAPIDETKLFPSSGLLTFFYDLKEQPWGFDPKDLAGYAIHYFPTNVVLERYRAPNSETELLESALQFWPAETLPNYGSRAGDRLLDELNVVLADEIDHDSLCELSRAVFRAQAPANVGPCHHLGGHAENIQGDMQLEAQLVMNGLYCGDPSGYDDPRATELEQTCEDWSLVLQLDSDDDAGFMWGDCGMLYYWARAADLGRRDFSKSWMSLQCC